MSVNGDLYLNDGSNKVIESNKVDNRINVPRSKTTSIAIWTLVAIPFIGSFVCAFLYLKQRHKKISILHPDYYSGASYLLYSIPGIGLATLSVALMVKMAG